MKLLILNLSDTINYILVTLFIPYKAITLLNNSFFLGIFQNFTYSFLSWLRKILHDLSKLFLIFNSIDSILCFSNEFTYIIQSVQLYTPLDIHQMFYQFRPPRTSLAFFVLFLFLVIN